MAAINLKNEKRIITNGQVDKVVTHPNNEPIFRQNGHELVFDSANSDDLIVSNSTAWTTWSDVNYQFTTDVSRVQNTNNLISFGDSAGDKFRLTRWSTGTFRGQLTIGSVTNDVQISWDVAWTTITIRQTNGIIYVNDVATLDFSARNAESLFSFNDFYFGSLSYTPVWYTNQTLHDAVIDNETFNPSDVNSSGQIVGSNGTVSTVSTSHASGLPYILGTVFQKSGFALAGNGTTEKIVGHLGTDLILTSTPLEGGFTLDGVVYNLTEGLGNEIKSTTGETASIQGFTGTGLNFGGWQKGNISDGWIPYTTI